MNAKSIIAVLVAISIAAPVLLGENSEKNTKGESGVCVLDLRVDGDSSRELRDESGFENHVIGHGAGVGKAFQRIERKDGGGQALCFDLDPELDGSHCWGWLPRTASLEAQEMALSFDIHPDTAVQPKTKRGVNILNGGTHIAHYRGDRSVARPSAQLYPVSLRLCVENKNQMRLQLALRDPKSKIRQCVFSSKSPLPAGRTTKVKWLIGENEVKLFLDGQESQSWPKKGEIIYDHPEHHPGNTVWQFGSGRFQGWLDNFRIDSFDVPREEKVAIKLRTQHDLNFFAQAEPKKIQVAVENLSDRELKGTLNWRVVDHLDREIAKGERSLTLKPVGAAPLELTIPSQKRGCFWLRCDFNSDGETLASRELNYAVGAIRDVSALPDESPFGIQPHVQPYYTHNAQCDIPDAGFKWVRLILARQRIEPNEGEYCWEAYDKVLNRLHSEGRKVMGSLFGMPKWAVDQNIVKKEEAKTGKKRSFRGYPPGDWKKHEDFLRKLITRYRDKVDVWEVWNECNTGYWDGTPEEYMKLLKMTHRLVRELDPDAQIIGPSICCFGWDAWSGEILAMGAAKYLDAFAGHYLGGGYGGNNIPESVSAQIGATRAMLNKYGGDKTRIWDGESGYLTATRLGPDLRPMSAEELKRRKSSGEKYLDYHYFAKNNVCNTNCSDELTVSDISVRRMALALANGVEKTFIHSVMPWHYEAELRVGNYNKGTCVTMTTIAWATMVEKLSGMVFDRRLDLGDDQFFGMVFKSRDGSRDLGVFWVAKGAGDIVLETDAAKVRRFDIWGNPEQVKTINPKHFKLTLTETPFYLENLGDSVETRSKILSFILPDFLSPSESAAVKLTAVNPTNRELRGELKIEAPSIIAVAPGKMAVTLAPGAKVEKVFKLTPTANAPAIDCPIKIVFDCAQDDYDESSIVYRRIGDAPFEVAETTESIVIDGDPGDAGWSGAPELTLGEEKQVVIGQPLVYGDPTCHQPDKEWVGPDDLSAKAKIRLKDGAMHLLIQVKDNVFTVDKRDNFAFLGDCVELFIDGRPEKEQNAPSGPGCYQLLITPGDDKHPRASLHWWGRSETETKSWPVELASRKTDDGYTLEAKIPLDKKRFPNLDLVDGRILGFDLVLDDADGAKRKSQMVWRGTKNNSKDASKLGKIRIKTKKKSEASNSKSELKNFSAAPDLRKGLVAIWSLTGDAKDAVGGNHGRAENVVFQKEDGFPCALFNGEDSSIRIKLKKALVTDNQFTVSAWVKPAMNFSKSNGLIVGRSGYHDGWRLVATDGKSKNNYTKNIATIGVGATKRGIACYGHRIKLVPGEWRHVVGLWNGIWLKVYIDGQLAGGRHYEGEYLPTQDWLSIGCASAGVGDYKGAIADIRIWDRPLERSEIQALLRQGAEKLKTENHKPNEKDAPKE